jgi:hypothetical protein
MVVQASAWHWPSISIGMTNLPRGRGGATGTGLALAATCARNATATPTMLPGHNRVTFRPCGRFVAAHLRPGQSTTAPEKVSVTMFYAPAPGRLHVNFRQGSPPPPARRHA